MVLDGSLGIPVRAASRLNCALKNALYCYATYLHAACPFGVPFRSQFCRAMFLLRWHLKYIYLHLSAPSVMESRYKSGQDCLRALSDLSVEVIVDRILGRLFSHPLQICSTFFVVLIPYCSFVLHNRKQVNPLFFNSFFFKVDE